MAAFSGTFMPSRLHHHHGYGPFKSIFYGEYYVPQLLAARSAFPRRHLALDFRPPDRAKLRRIGSSHRSWSDGRRRDTLANLSLVHSLAQGLYAGRPLGVRIDLPAGGSIRLLH